MAHADISGHAQYAFDRAKRTASSAVDAEKLEKLARVGLLTKGILYAVTATLALRAAFGNGESVGSKGALMEIASKPFGTILLSLMAAGLIAYALFRLAQAAFDLDRKGSDAKGILQRSGQAVTGAIYATLGAWAISVLVGSRASSGSGGGKTWIARMLTHDWGPWLIGLAAIAVFGAAISQFVRAYRHTFLQDLRRRDMSAQELRVIRRAGEIGFAGRGVVFLMMAWFYTRAAFFSDASEVGGLNKALDTMHQQAWGAWLLGAMALCLLAYALYCGFAAKYRTV